MTSEGENAMKKWKRRFQRWLGIFLAVSIIAEFIPFTTVKAVGDELILLNTVHSDLGEIDETYSHFSIGTVQSEVAERGSYILTIYRDGNIDSKATVDLASADISAKYGKDYIVKDDNITEEYERDQTMLETTADEELQKITADVTEELEKAVESSMETDKEAVEETKGEEEDVSSLAQMKENQTGLPTRENYDAEGLPLQDVLFENLGVDLGQEIITSSTTHLVFEP